MRSLRQLRDEELHGPFETVAQLGRSATATMERRGVALIERTEHDEPGPIRAAAIELDDGAQFIVIEHFAHPDQFLELRAQLGRGTARELTAQFSRATGLTESDIDWIADG